MTLIDTIFGQVDDAQPPYDSSDHASKMTSDYNKQFTSDIPKLDDRGGKIEQDVMLDAIEGKVCKSIDLSQTNNFNNESDSRAAPCPYATSETGLNVQEDMFYMDKTVTDIEQPHMAASTKAAPTIKDICIDEGVQMFEKKFSCWNFPRVNGNSEETRTKVNSEDLKPISTNEGLGSLEKIVERNVGDKETLLVAEYPVKQCHCSSAVSEKKLFDTTETTSTIPYEEVIDQRSHILEDINTNFPRVDSSSHNDGTSEKQDPGQKLDQVSEEEEDLTTMAASSPDKAKESKPIAGTVSGDKDLFEKEKTSQFVVISNETKSDRIDNTSGTSDDPKIDVVTHTSDLGAGDPSIVGNENRVVNNQQGPQSQNYVENEDPVSDGATSARSSFSQLAHGDMNPLGPANFSGSITASHTQQSGNISLRSESSTTSGQSFAFPVLQPEWSSSPVRMAKADRRHLRKHRWRTALTCCKF
ncbi:uncharacterized protein LOC110025120 isoform X2 [Phalaenopsis equestris]|nr:uncharacterized protein LOC110025120 isoform X2 [Phalaenopsis equestris]